LEGKGKDEEERERRGNNAEDVVRMTVNFGMHATIL
jgi:hypothetical protein